MPADLSWLDGTVEDAAAMLADRAVASRALGGVVKAGECPAWADDLIKAAALVKCAQDPPVVPPAAPAPTPAPAPAAGGVNGFIDRNLGGLKTWAGEQARSAIGKEIKGSPEVQNAMTGGLAGAGIGMLGGLGASVFSKNKRKRPVRNAMFGGMLGGLGGAAIGGLGGAGGLFGKQRAAPGAALAMDQQMAEASDAMKNRDEVTVMKTFRGLNSMNNSDIAKGFGYGAGGYLGAETGVRAMGRYAPGMGNYSRTHLNTDALRAGIAPGAATTSAGWAAKGAPAPVKADVDSVRRALQASKLEGAKALGLKGDRAIVGAMTGKGWTTSNPVAGRTKLMTPGSLLRSGKAGLLGTLVSGASKGVDLEKAEIENKYFKTMGTDLKSRYSHLDPLKYTPGGDANADVGAALGPNEMSAQTRLGEIMTRLTDQTKGPLQPTEVESLSGEMEAIKSRMQIANLKRIEAQRAAAGQKTGR